MKTFYEVRWVIYQYNGGGQIKNGNILCKESFLDLKTACKLTEQIVIWITHPETRDISNFDQFKNYNEFIDHYVWDGYLVKLDGLYKITEEKLP